MGRRIPGREDGKGAEMSDYELMLSDEKSAKVEDGKIVIVDNDNKIVITPNDLKKLNYFVAIEL
jgi:hypothetical protein